MKEIAQRMASARPESSAVLLLQDVNDPNKIFQAKQSQHPSRPVLCCQYCASKPPYVKSLQLGDSYTQSGGNPTRRWHSNFFFGLGEPEGFRSEMFRRDTPSASSGRCEPTQNTGAVIILILPRMSSRKMRPEPRLVLCKLVSRDKSVKKPSNQNA